MVKLSKNTLTVAVLFDIAILVVTASALILTLYMFCSFWGMSNAKFFEKQETQQMLGVDYVKYMSQADMALHDPARLYDVEAQTKWMHDHVSAQRYKTLSDLSPSYYPPPFCLISTPFLALDIPKGLMLWCSLQVLALILLVVAMVRKSPTEWVYFWAILIGCLGSRQAIIFGQTSFLMASLVAALYYCWLKNKQLPAGVLLALAAVLKPHHCLVPFVMIVAKRQWKTFISFALTLLVMFGICVYFLGLPVVLGYPAALYSIEQNTYSKLFNETFEVCINFRGVVANLMPGEQARIISNLLLLADVLGCYWIWRKSLTKGPQSFGLAMVVTTCLSLAFNLHANFYDLPLLILPCALTLEAVGVYSSLVRENIKFRLWSASFPIFWTITLIHSMLSRRAANWHLLYLTVYAVWSLWFWCKIPTTAVSASEQTS